MSSLITPTVRFCHVYALRSLKDGNNYIGLTDNSRERLEAHRKGLVFATKSRMPFRLIRLDGFLNKEDARQREKYLKSTNGRRWLGKRLRRYNISA